MTGQRGRYVGIGVGSYTDPAHQDLPEAGRDVTSLHALLARYFDGEPLLDPGESEIRGLLKSVKDSVHDGAALVLAWSGHGVPAPPELGRLRLLGADSDTDAVAGLPIAEVIAGCAQSGAGQILAVIDTCFSGAGLAPASEVAALVMAARPPEADRLWVGVLAASAADASAYDGVLGERLRELLE